jgi:pilus assembly protein Flp/PilA
MRPHRGFPKLLTMPPTSTIDTTRLADESGVTAIEYGLLAALIAVAIIGAVSATGTSLGAIYQSWTTAVINAILGAL